MFMNKKELFAYRMNKAREAAEMAVIAFTTIMGVMTMFLFM